MPAKTRKTQMSFPQAIRSFVGYLEGSHKSHHTIKNYQFDILAFRDFIYQEYSGKNIHPSDLTLNDLERYRQFLQKKGFKTNTRRRKILTVSQFLNYLAKRKKLAPSMAKKIPAPHKLERIPYTTSSQDLIQKIQILPTTTLLGARNRALLWTLAETGCLVREVTQIRFEHWSCSSPNSAQLEIVGKFPRKIPVSLELYEAIQDLKPFSQKGDSLSYIFLGFNKFGSLGSAISPRGVELLVKAYADQLGCPDLTPRTFRHSVILYWFSQGLAQNEVQNRLGLKTTYAFRSYEPLIKSVGNPVPEMRSV